MKNAGTLATAALFAGSLASGAAMAADAPHSFSGKVALYSEYEYRGLAQTAEKPALQFTLDYAHSSGFYAGTFLTNIKWLQDSAEMFGEQTDARVEWDIYGGYKWAFAPGWTLDVGYLRYEYPSSNAIGTALVKPNTDEVYAGVSFGPATLKYSYSINELFGVPGSEGSDYLELSVNYPVIDKLTLNALVGHQRYKGHQPSAAGDFDNSQFDYTVWKIGATYEFGNGWSAGAYYKGTDADPIYFTLKGKDTSRDRVVGFVAWSF